MKNNNILLSSLLAVLLWSCNTLDIENLTDYDANAVWNEEKLATAYLNDLYANIFTNWDAGWNTNSEQTTGIPFYANVITISGSSYKKWNYTLIRQINSAIQELEGSRDLADEVKSALKAQALFMRAYVYFEMVVYHGGIPYIKVPQDRYADDLKVKRNTTAECFQFMIDDLDAAIAALPDKNTGSSDNYGRLDKAYAMAFKAKVLLQKCSPQFNPSKPYDNSYWQEAYTAAKAAYDFCKANGSALEPSYDNIFANEGGPEVLFAVINKQPDKVAYWEWYLRPQSLSVGQTACTPTWDMVKFFSMADGKQFDDPTGKYTKTEDELMQSFWENRDPRFYSSILCSGQTFPVAGKPADYRQYTALGLADDADAYGTNPNSGVTSTKNDMLSGFYIRKALDLSLTQDKTDLFDRDRIIMRFAELMLIYAETANETGHLDVTLDMLKQIRQRAGIEAGGDGNYGLPAGDRIKLRQAILQERNIEFCFEGHRFWDLRRTRNLNVLSGLKKYGLESIAINPDRTEMDINTAKAKAKNFELTPADFKYKKQIVPYNPNAENTFVVDDTFYFFPLQQTWLDENENLEQNNNWGGTFNPTME